ncbi:N-acetyltransferase [Bacteroidales bacterium OttesenSCG-928-I21]|nr:N-acetyltransferase [Bacteroidales bacterium OttesenSCG-928-I21]
MEIIQKNYEDSGIIKAMDDNIEIGKMTYVWAGLDKFIIDYTYVKDSYTGEGIGSELVKSAVDYARDNNIKIIPLCPFASNIFKKNPEYSDVLNFN